MAVVSRRTNNCKLKRTLKLEDCCNPKFYHKKYQDDRESQIYISRPNPTCPSLEQGETGIYQSCYIEDLKQYLSATNCIADQRLAQCIAQAVEQVVDVELYQATGKTYCLMDTLKG